MRDVSERELKQIERQGGKVPPRKRDKPAPVAETEVGSASPAPTVPSSPQVEPPAQDVLLPTLLEAQNQLIAHNSAVIERFGEELKQAIHNRAPVPWNAKVNRNDKGFIDNIDLIPKVAG